MRKPVAVLLHGFLGHPSDWDDVSSRLVGDVSVRCPFLPGHDPAKPREVRGLGFADCVRVAGERIGACDLLVGYSMGGRMALAAMLDGRVQPRAAVIISASIGLESDAARVDRRVADLRLAEDLERDGLPVFLESWYRLPLFSSLDARPDLREALMAKRSAGDAASLADALRAMSVAGQPDFAPALRSCGTPVLFIAGDADPKYAAEAARAARLSRPGLHRIVRDSGHMPHIEQPAAVAAAIREFLATEAR